MDDPSARGRSLTNHGVVGALTTIFDPRSVGDLRFQFAIETLCTNDAAGPGIAISGYCSSAVPTIERARSESTPLPTRTAQHGASPIKGASYQSVHEQAAMADDSVDLHLRQLDHLAAGRPNQFRQAFGAIGTNFGVTNVGAFFTDRWSVTKKLTMDLGLRYDFESLPSPFRENTRNFSPRLGLAYHAASSWVLRAGFGILFRPMRFGQPESGVTEEWRRRP
jgi:hypothetical protein